MVGFFNGDDDDDDVNGGFCNGDDDDVNGGFCNGDMPALSHYLHCNWTLPISKQRKWEVGEIAYFFSSKLM